MIAALVVLALFSFGLPLVLATPEASTSRTEVARLDNEGGHVVARPPTGALHPAQTRVTLIDTVERSTQPVLRGFAGRVMTEQGVGLANGRLVAVAPRSLSSNRAIRRETALEKDGSFSLPLPAHDWDGHITFAAVYDFAGMMLESGFVRIGDNVVIPVKSQSDESWYVDGAIELRGAPHDIAGWLAVYGVGALQPLAESQFKGERSGVRLRFNLSDDTNYPGEVSAHVLAPGLRSCKTLSFASLQAFREAFAAGLAIEVSNTSLLIPPFPHGGLATRIQLAPMNGRFLNTGWQEIEFDRVTVTLSDTQYKITGAAADGKSAFGVVELLDSRSASARWYVETPGPHTQVIATIDEEGRPIVAARLGAALMMSDLSMHGLFSVSATTDSNGEAKLEGLPPGDYSIKAKHPDAVGFPAVSSIVSVPSRKHTVIMHRPTLVWVEPVWHDGPDVIGQFVTYWRRSADPVGHWERREVSTKLGHAVVQGLPSGNFDLYVYAEPYLGFAHVFVGPAQGPQTIAVSCAIPAGISGQLLTVGDSPIAGRWISMSRECANGRPLGFEWNRARTDENGAFWICPDGSTTGKIVAWNAPGNRPATEMEASAATIIRVVE